MFRTGRGRTVAAAALVTAAALAAGAAAAQSTTEGTAAGAGGETATAEEEKPYIHENGAFDYGVYNGYRRYHAHCHVCHGPDALGSTFAPALADSLKRLSYEEFLEVVVNGRENVAAGQQNVMPSFGTVDDVMLYIDHLYAYLKARADGVLERGRPQRLPPDNDPVWQEYQAQRG